MSKLERLDAIATRAGVIAAVAMDQRSSLRRMIAQAAGAPEETIPDAQLGEFKTAVTEALSAYGSAILLDPEYGLEAARRRAEGCGLLLTYEADGFDNPRPHRMLALMARISTHRLAMLGADAIKILLSWAPDDDEDANDEKRVLIERIGNECEGLGMPFLLEPVVYDPTGADPRSNDYLRRKPELVIRTMQEFSDPVYKVDVLKVEFPVNASCVGAVHSRDEALDWYRAADSATPLPYIYLSAGAAISDFLQSLELASEAGAHFSGVLCGRALWQDGIGAFVKGGRAAFSQWLAADGVRNAQRIGECLKTATSWRERIAGGRR
jgi:tagatose 1,6-diphosphate aldolase